MKALTVIEGIVAPMDRSNVDTGMVIPKEFLKSIKRSGFGPTLFEELRDLDEFLHKPKMLLLMIKINYYLD